MRDIGRALTGYLATGVRADFPFRLVRLWRSWTEVLGEETARLVRPLGHRHTTLLLGAEDPAALQEATYYVPEILDRVNAFLKETCFDGVQLNLLMNRIPLDVVPVDIPSPRLTLSAPETLGAASQHIPPDSPAGRAYRAYVALFKGSQG